MIWGTPMTYKMGPPSDSVQLRYKWLNSMLYGRYNYGWWAHHPVGNPIYGSTHSRVGRTWLELPTDFVARAPRNVSATAGTSARGNEGGAAQGCQAHCREGNLSLGEQWCTMGYIYNNLFIYLCKILNIKESKNNHIYIYVYIIEYIYDMIIYIYIMI